MSVELWAMYSSLALPTRVYVQTRVDVNAMWGLVMKLYFAAFISLPPLHVSLAC